MIVDALGEALVRLSTWYQLKSDNEEDNELALECLRKSASLFEEQFGPNDKRTHKIRRKLSLIYLKLN
jgi:hypothetical protein